jgi:heterodisulfide reductase subunit B
MRYAFFPGCSLAQAASAYADSIGAVSESLGLNLAEIADWNCCGATAYIAVDLLPAYALVARNLALVDGDLDQLVTPCSLCYVNLRKAQRALDEHDALRARVDDALAAGGLRYRPGRTSVRHLLDVVVNDIGLEAVASRVVRPLYGLRVAPYYGCLTVRPGGGFDDPEQPASLDLLLRVLGAEVVEFPLKADCCGGHMTLTSAEVAYTLLRRLLQSATDHGADLVVTLCPMCQLNLDVYQHSVNRQYGTNFRLPVLFFTQAMGLAFGLARKAVGIGKEIVPAGPVLDSRWSAEPAPEKERRPRRSRRDASLPMSAARDR